MGEGCIIDQILGQWHAEVAGIGDFLDADKVSSALGAVHASVLRLTGARIISPDESCRRPLALATTPLPTTACCAKWTLAADRFWPKPERVDFAVSVQDQ
jgi:hypothetical protein